jgi:sphingosine kinase
MDLSEIDAVLAVGGDGTLHECVNGLMQRKDKEILSRVPLVTIPAGTGKFHWNFSPSNTSSGNSFAHELHGGVELERVVNRVIRGIHLPIDLALIKCENGESFYSFNSIHWGLGAKVVVTAEKWG